MDSIGPPKICLMQPADKRTRLFKATAARGRMFIKKNMGWLPGCPLSCDDGKVRWLVIPRRGEDGAHVVDIDRTRLQRAILTRSKLIHRFPRALPRIVGDVDLWAKSTQTLFGWVKDALHEGRPLPPNLIDQDNFFSRHSIEQTRRLRASEPRLRNVLDANSWIYFSSPNDFSTVVDWLDQHRAHAIALVEHGQTDDADSYGILSLLELVRRDGSAVYDALFRIVIDHNRYAYPSSRIEHLVNHYRRALRELRHNRRVLPLPSQPPPQPSDAFGEFINWLLQYPQPTRRRALRLVDRVLMPPIEADWTVFWARWESVGRNLQNLQARVSRQIRKHEFTALTKEIDAALATCPPQISLSQTLKDIRSSAVASRAKFYNAITGVLDALNALDVATIDRVNLFRYFVAFDRSNAQGLVSLLHAFRDYLERHVSADTALWPWREELDKARRDPSARWFCYFDDLIHGSLDRPQRRAFFIALSHYVQQPQRDDMDADIWLLLDLIKLDIDPELALQRLLALRSAGMKGFDIKTQLFRFLETVSDRTDEFARLYQRLDHAFNYEKHEERPWITTDELLKQNGWPDMLKTVVLNDAAQNVIDIVRLISIQQDLDAPITPPPCSDLDHLPERFDDLPSAIRQPARLLATLPHVSPQKLDRLLRPLLPAPDDWCTELTNLKARLIDRPQDVRLTKRVERLQQWLAGHYQPNRATERKVRDRLERTIRRAVLHAWKQNLIASLEAGLRASLQTTTDVSVLLDPKHFAVISQIAKIEKNRAIAWRLLNLRCGLPPWHLYNEDKSRAFFDRMTQLGLHIDAWRNPPPPIEWSLCAGATVLLSIESDPLEVFQMGTPFSTCLTPGDINFFSVFANAADANKHVLFGRDATARIVARCLFALSDEGGLLVFHPYCHHKEWKFGDRMRSYAEDWARQLNTIVIQRGKVSCLVSEDWYDDGPQDYAHRFECLQEGSALRRILATNPAAGFRDALVTAFVPHGLNALTLPMVLMLPELKKRPDILRAILSDFENCDMGMQESWGQIIGIIADDDHALCRRLIRERYAPALRRNLDRLTYSIPDAFETVARLEPTIALRLLRNSRPNGVRTDDAEFYDGRRNALATAYRALHRDRKAAALVGRNHAG